MTSQRLLPLINLAGCVIITGVILAQWSKERGIEHKLETADQQRLAALAAKAEVEKRVVALEADVAQLKASIEDTAKARQLAEDEAAKVTAEHNAKMAEFATASQDQVKTWESAIAERDERIRELNISLAATRSRLNEAIAKLKEAGAR